MAAPHIEMQGITKDFPGVRALDNVSFSVNRGEVHALVGENGAGKSTLIKILSGLYAHGTYQGAIRIEGQERKFRGVRDAERAGVGVIYQELSLVKELAVGENIFIGREPSSFGVISWNTVYARTRDLLNDLGLDVNPRARIKYLGTGQQQLVEIAKALSMDASILILDEPTAALTESEVGTLMRIIRGLKQRGVSCIYISHKLNEVFEIADRITVLRDGRSIGTYDTPEVDEKKIIADMVGRELTDMYPKEAADEGDVVLAVRGLTAYDPEIETRKVLNDVSFEARAGQVLGIAGLMGAGRSELLNSIFGAWRGSVRGSVLVNGKPVSVRSPHDAIRCGMALVTEDRKRFGLILEASVAHNVTLAGLDRVCGSLSVINPQLEQKLCSEQIEALRIKTPNAETAVNTLSGGNQQKVVLAKCLLTQPRVLFLDEPTRGIDVGAKTEIYQIMNRLAQQGVAIVMVSSELPEVLGMSDRILVMREGRIAGELHRDDATQESIMALATGAAV